MNRLTAMAMVAVATVGCANGAPDMSFQMDSALDNRALVTDRVIVRFAGFQAGEQVTVRARMADGAESFAVFAADENGAFDTARIPLSGSYQGADPDGLFYSMRSRTPSMVTDVALHVTFSAEVDGNEVAQARLERYASPELMPVPERDLCGGIPCPVPPLPVELPQDPVPLSAPVAANAANENPDDPCGVGPRPVGPQPTPEPVQQLVELAQQLEEVMEQRQ